jgi:hypothetical protein
MHQDVLGIGRTPEFSGEVARLISAGGEESGAPSTGATIR